MRVTIITTLDHNVGDDFVREGILYLLEAASGPPQVALIHKHIPVTARPEFDWYYHGGWSRRLDRLPKPLGLRGSRILDGLPLNRRTDKVLNCDLLVQSGAPVYWLHPHNSCADAEWYPPLIGRRWRQVADQVPLINLAGGTCQRYHSDGSEFKQSPRTLDHIRRFFDECRLTTLRDQLSQDVLRQVDRRAEVLPCTSIFARDYHRIEAAQPSYVALNFMPDGGHYDFGQGIDSDRWRTTFQELTRRMARRERCVLVCHNESERKAASRWFPDVERFYARDFREILEFYAAARYGVVNRVHAAFAIASYGRPSIVIGTDSRARMAEEIGVRSFFVSETTADQLEEEAARLPDSTKAFRESFEERRQRARRRYLELIEPILLPAAGRR